MSDECAKETVISKQTRITVGMVLVIIGAVFFAARSSFYAEAAQATVKKLEKKNETFEQSMQKFVQAQTKLTIVADNNQKKTQENSNLLRKLGEVQLQQQLILNTQRIELKYIKKASN